MLLHEVPSILGVSGLEEVSDDLIAGAARSGQIGHVGFNFRSLPSNSSPSHHVDD